RDVDPRAVSQVDAIEPRGVVDCRLAGPRERALQRAHDLHGSEHMFDWASGVSTGHDGVMTPDAKTIVQRFLADSRDPETGEWRPDVIRECFDVERYFSHTWGAGLVETGRRMGEFFTAFGGSCEKIADTLVADGDFVVHHSSWRAEHVGPVLGVEPTGRTV